jgi:hypothetical protein
MSNDGPSAVLYFRVGLYFDAMQYVLFSLPDSDVSQLARTRKEFSYNQFLMCISLEATVLRFN